jgi:DNA-binding winged helix-turn-helix (wHTH) protein/tetratricopeptide (TPR) repeat protein
MSESSLSQTLRFATFEVDLRSGELRKNGIKLKLQEKPFHVLALLLERPGELITREELREKLWPADTFVDFDHSLGTAIAKLRQALSDSAQNPRFVETVSSRGYRFVAPVRAPPEILPDAPAPRGSGIRWFGSSVVGLPVVAMFLSAAAVAGSVWLWRSQHKPRLTDRDTIVLADFANTTGELVFDDTLKQGLRVQLEQSPYLNILSDENVSEALQMMGRQKNGRLTKDLARDLCQRVGSKAFLASSISSLGTHYVIGLNALNCQTGDELASEQVEADSREHVLKALGESATRMRKKLGESLSSIQRFDTPIEQVTTASLEALHAYSLGMKNKSEGRLEGIPFLKRATELDPNFAAAYARLGISYRNLWQFTLASENFRKAFELRDRVSERERLFFSVGFDLNVIGDLEKAAQTCELWAQTYTRDALPRTTLADYYMKTGQWTKALGEAQQALRLDPNYSENYFNLGSVYLAIGRLDEADDVVRQAMTRKMDSPVMHLILYWIAFLRQETRGMEQQINWNSGSDYDLLLYAGSDTEAYRARLMNARSLSDRAVELARRAYGKERAAAWKVNAALRESEFGNRRQAVAEAEAAMKMAMNWEIEAVGALGLARAGETIRADQLAAQLNKNFPMSTMLQGYWLPTIRAAIELNRGNATKAIELLQGAAPYELAVSTPSELGTMYPVYVRGQAYLLAHKGKEAAGEFQKIIDHPGVVLNFPLGALARLGLARAYALQGDTAKSPVKYQDFFTLWKDADPDVPVLREAKAEFAKLK